MTNRLVAFHYVLKNQDGETLDDSAGSEPLKYVEGQSQIIPGLEEALKPLKLGDKKNVKIEAANAYGEYEEALVMDLPKTQFPAGETIEVGDQFRMNAPDSPPRIFTVMELKTDSIRVDGNHPLAGTDLYFDVEITEAREATEADLEEEEGCCGADHEHDHDHAHDHEQSKH